MLSRKSVTEGNALEPGTVMPIHRHIKSSESIAIIRGRIAFRLYDDNGQPTAEYILTPGGQYPMIHIEAGQWHSLEVLEEGSVVLESKDGMYEPLGEDEVWRQ